MSIYKNTSYGDSHSQQCDIRDRSLNPLYKYGLREARVHTEVRYEPHYGYGCKTRYDPYECYTCEITLDQKGFSELVGDLERIEHEEWLRKNNPSLQAAWDHYQTILNLVK